MNSPAGTPSLEQPGISGEFHSQGALLLAARTARRAGFAADCLWFIGEPSTDATGEPVGFARPASTIRELGLAGVILGLLTGALVALTLPRPGEALLGRLLVDALGLAAAGGVLGAFGAWANLSAQIGQYLLRATGGGALRLKITLPAGGAAFERERAAELAERALRAAKAETLTRLDGSVEINSPQSSAYVA